MRAKFHFDGAERGGEAQLRGHLRSQVQLGSEGKACARLGLTGVRRVWEQNARCKLAYHADRSGIGFKVGDVFAQSIVLHTIQTKKWRVEIVVVRVIIRSKRCASIAVVANREDAECMIG